MAKLIYATDRQCLFHIFLLQDTSEAAPQTDESMG
jgi:hypothetical protein